MEVLQCDGCDFRAESNDELKAHIQDVHTAFLQPAEVGEGDGSPRRSRSKLLKLPQPNRGRGRLEQSQLRLVKKEAGISTFAIQK